MERILDELEKIHRRSLPKRFRAPSSSELFVISAMSFFSAPFVSATFLLVPLIGQGLVLFFFSLVGIFFFVRRSWLVFICAVIAHLAFVIPAIAIIPSIKHRLDLAYFVLLALGIPVVVLMSLLVAARAWMEVELRDQQKPVPQPVC